MKRLFSMYKTAFIAVLALGLLSSCHTSKDINPELKVESPASTEGDDAVLHLAFAGLSGEASVNCFIFEYNAISGKVGEKVEDLSFYGSDGQEISFPFSFEIPSSEKYDIYVRGLDAGTFYINVSLKAGKNAFICTAVTVVKSSGMIDPPEQPGDDEKTVEDFTVPTGPDGENDLSMTVGETLVFSPVVTPTGIGDVVFDAVSLTPDYLAAESGTNKFTLTAIAPGKAEVTVKPTNVNGPEKRFHVTVKAKTISITDFSLPEIDKLSGFLETESGDDFEFTPVVEPAGVTGVEFAVVSSDPEVADVAFENGKIIIKPRKPGYCSVSVSPANAEGPTKAIPVMVYKNVTIKVDFYELETTEEQIQQKTFPCYVRFSSDSEYAFDYPVTFTVSTKAVVSASEYDSKTCTDKREVKFYGNKNAYYDITKYLLIPASNLLPVDNFTLRISLSLEKNDSFDPKLWRVTYNNVYLTQTDVRIKQFLTENLQ